MQSIQLLLIAVFLFISTSNCDLILGGHRDISQDDLQKVQPLLIDSLKQLKEQENGETLHLVNIISAKSQVVQGKLYNINAEFATEDNKITKNCKVKLWHQPWNSFQETSFECDDSSKFKVTKQAQARSKRSLVGGPTEVEAETIEELRKNITASFVQLGAEGKPQLEVRKILGASQKVVAGVLYTVRAEIASPDGVKLCTIEVWRKPWINFEQVNVKCDNGENYQTIKDNRQKRSSEEERPLLFNEEANIVESPEASLFNQFKIKHGRVYDTDEEHALRFRIFKQNLFQIRQLNKFELGTAIYDVTDFADLTFEEYKQRTGLWKRTEDESNDIRNPLADIPDIELPVSFDWREHQAVTPVKNQGGCGSCWAFSVTGNIEGLHAVKYGNLESYSEQELVDCDKTDAGCNGGLPDNAYKAIESIGGLELETEYPYKARQSKSCGFNKTLSHARVTGAIDFKEKDEVGIAKWLSVNGPVSIGINANAMQFYRGGVSHPWKALCSSKSLDHGVLLVGFGIAEYPMFNKTLPYWIVKNSWGPKWGEQGYYRVYRGDNTCGVSSMASSAVLA